MRALIAACLIAASFSGFAQSTDDPLEGLARREAISKKIVAADKALSESEAQFQSAKAACAQKVLVNPCVADALEAKRQRNDVIGNQRAQARAELRQQSLAEKNLALSQAQGDERADALAREQSLKDRKQRLEQWQERVDGHNAKKSKEAENRAAYQRKQADSAEKQAQIKARLEKSAAEKKAEAKSDQKAAAVTASAN